MAVSIGILIIGLLLVSVALTGTILRRLPLSAAMLYVAVGIGLGPAGMGVLRIDPIGDARTIELVTTAAVVISLFTAGLKLRVSLRDPRWWLSMRLAVVAMVITVGLVAFVGVSWLGLSLGAAVLLGAILAPTDPVLASDVQVRRPTDRDRLRFSLTSEAGLNDGTAFPFVFLGLGLLGLREIGPNGLRWLTLDVVWAVSAGLVIGALLGTLIGRLVIYLRQTHKEAVGLDDFLALGLIALAYGTAEVIHALGFLSVFSAGLAVRRIEARHAGEAPPPDVRLAASSEDAAQPEATHPKTAPAYMTEAVLAFNEQIDRLGAMAVVLLVGAMLPLAWLGWEALLLTVLLFVVVRPLAVALALAGSSISLPQRRLMAWFGVRGVGSIYYLSYAITHGLETGTAQELARLTLAVVAASVIVHGVSVTPLMAWYDRRQERHDRAQAWRRSRHGARRRREEPEAG